MSNPERADFNPESKRTNKTLVNDELWDVELEKSFHEFATQTGRQNAGLTSPESRIMRREWLLQQTETSPELNKHIMSAIIDAEGDLGNNLKDGNKEGALASIEQLRGLINKLEQGVANIE